MQACPQRFQRPGPRIARLRARDFLEDETLLAPENFAVDFAICPEQIITDYISRLIEFPEALQVIEFARVGSAWSRCGLTMADCWWQTDQRNAQTFRSAWMPASPQFSARTNRSSRGRR